MHWWALTRALSIQKSCQTFVVDSKSCQISIPSFAQCDWNLSRSPFLRQVVDVDLVFLCLILSLRPMNAHKIDHSNERCYGQEQVLASSIKIFISHENQIYRQWLITGRNLQSIKTFLTCELSQYSKRGSTFSSNKPVEVHSHSHLLGNTLYLCLPVQPAQALSCARAQP